MADFYFFTDAEKLADQTNNEAFGHTADTTINNESYENFRVASMHASQIYNINAYAICDGRIFLQDIGNNLVNLILKPRVQPTSVNPNIKYYIYRGIRKNSLISSGNVIQDSNNLTQDIYENITRLNGDTSENVFGINLSPSSTPVSYQDTDPIDKVYYHKSSVQFDLWEVKGGWNIGKFDNNGFGLEIIIDNLGYNPTLALARSNTANNHVVSVKALPANANHQLRYIHQNEKEEVLNYLDPVAFYGNFRITSSNNPNKLYLISPGSQPTNNITTPNMFIELQNKDELYAQLLALNANSAPVFRNRILYIWI